jgi:hypothetical protein
MATLPTPPGQRVDHRTDAPKEEKRCVTCGHTVDSHEKPSYPHTLRCLDAGCVCGAFVEGTAGSVAAVKKEEEEAAAKKKEEEAKQKKEDELKAAKEKEEAAKR